MSMTKEHMEMVLFNLGINLEDENFQNSPARFIKYLEHYIQPYDPSQDLKVDFGLSKATTVKDNHNEFNHAMVVQTNIPYRAVCAHHLLPVHDVAHLGYIPRERVVGLSKLTRVVQGIAHAMPSLQEAVGNSVVEALMEHLNPIGAICVINAEHGCMHARGVQEVGVQTVTSSIRGIFQTDSKAREEFYALIGMNT